MEEERKIAVEEVESVPAPRRAKVQDAVAVSGEGLMDDEETSAEKLDRKRDYLEGFLTEKPQGVSPGAPGGDIYEGVIAALKEIFDPEIPVNIYELGLIYGVDVTDDGGVAITMTLTTPHCPVAESMPGEVELRVSAVPGVRDCEVNLVWDPPWDMTKMSDEAKLELGML
jgi:FeS assembly SUF system protein